MQMYLKYNYFQKRGEASDDRLKVSGYQTSCFLLPTSVLFIWIFFYLYEH